MIELLIFGLLTLAVLSLWLLIEGRKNPKFLIWFIPLLLILTTSIYITYTSILGLPKVARPEKGVYLKHYIDEPNWIYLWVVSQDNIPKSFQIPYSKGTHKALEGVKGKADEDYQSLQLNSKQKTMILDMAAKVYGTLIYGRLHEALEGTTEDEE